MNLFIGNFKGIRKLNQLADLTVEGVISAVVSENVELRRGEDGAGAGIGSMPGNTIVASLADESLTIGGDFETVQQGKKYRIIYAANETEGFLYKFDGEDFELIFEGLTPTDNCNGITLAQGFEDYFVFSNGIDEIVAVNFSHNPVAEFKETHDEEGREIRGLGLESQDGRLAIICDNRVHWSKQMDIFNFYENAEGILTNSAFQEFDRPVTAIKYYKDNLIVFTNDYSVRFSGNPADPANFTRHGATGGGCSSFGALVVFDNRLFYFDPNMRNIYAYELGEVSPEQNNLINSMTSCGDDVRSYFLEMDEAKCDDLRIIPCVSGDRREIWVKFTKKDGGQTILILNYDLGEWAKRVGQKINSLLFSGGKIFSSSANNLLIEYEGEKFGQYPDGTGGEFIPSDYKTSVINLGDDATLKTPRGALILTFQGGRDCDFFMEFIYNNNPETAKRVRVVKKFFDKMGATFADNDDDLGGGFFVDGDEDIAVDSKTFTDEKSGDVTAAFYPPLRFKQLQLRFYTEEEGQSINIKRLSVKNVTADSGAVW
jgi:hypothetical protein